MKISELKIKNNYLELSIGINKRVNLVKIINRLSGQVYADKPYKYFIKYKYGSKVLKSKRFLFQRHSLETGNDGSQILTLSGMLDAGKEKTNQLQIKQVFIVPSNLPYFEEYLRIKNTGKDCCQIEDMRLGFRKRLYYSQERERGLGYFHLIAVPYKRGCDNKIHDYSIEDIFNNRFENSAWDYEIIDLPLPISGTQRTVDRKRGRSEGWVWTNEEEGLLIIKYNQEMIEYSMVETEEFEKDKCLIFGGIGFCLYKEPRAATRINPGEEIAFGVNRYTFFKGGWKEGYLKFKEFMREKGHSISKQYHPLIHWNVLFDIGWYHSDRKKLFKYYTRENLFQEAEKAKDIGCELLYLDPGWEVCEGTTLWDKERLGEVEDFIKTIKKRYGLEVGFRTVGRVYRDEFPHQWYIQRSEREGKYTRPLKKDKAGHIIGVAPFWEPCTQCREWKEEKLRRILTLCKAGMKFIMFDEFEWRGPCYNREHGHPIPSTPEGHVRAVYWLIEEVHKRYPEILIEAHDPVWSWHTRYLPTYYRHGLPHAYEENWAFEFMWNPLEDLISGQAFILYYYNLAYAIPLYDHIPIEKDNDNCLAFWWIASTVRHLGIGGKKGLGSKEENKKRYQAYKEAMRQYKELKEFYTRGEFYGIDEYTHVHTLPQRNQAVINVFNLTGQPIEKQREIILREIGLTNLTSLKGVSYQRTNKGFIFNLEIPPLSPRLITVNI